MGIFALLLLLSWQGLFWWIVHSTERAARPVDMDGRTQIDYLLLDAQGRPSTALPSAAQRDGLDGYSVTVPKSAELARIRFLLPFQVADLSQAQALFLAIREQIAEIRLNGTVIQASEPLARLEGLLTSEPAFYLLPTRQLRLGANLLEIDKDLIGFDTALSEFAVGPVDILAEVFRWKNLLLTDLALIGVGVLLFTLLLCLAVNWPDADRPRIRALMLLLASCALGTWFLTFNPPVELGLFASMMVWCLINIAIAIAITVYVLFDIGVPARRARQVYWAWLILPGVFGIGFLIAALGLSQRYWLFQLVNAVYWLVIVAATLALVLLAAAVVRDQGRRWFERSVLAMCICALAMDRLGSIFDLFSPFDPDLPLTLPWSPLIGALLGLSMVFALAREAAQARRTVLDANQVLAQTLAQRESELAASFAERNQIMQRSAMLEERGRIVRDMHDGIGGQLLSLQMQVQAQQLDHGALVAALDDSLCDLRLIVDSLDTAEDGLYDALVAFERRIRQQATAATCRVISSHQIGQVPDQFGARITLQVLRILQEAVSNALRHGKATEIRLESALDPDIGRIVLRVQDNGCGIATDVAMGHGLANMRHRAAAIGATLNLQSDASGTRVVVVLPPLAG